MSQLKRGCLASAFGYSGSQRLAWAYVHCRGHLLYRLPHSNAGLIWKQMHPKTMLNLGTPCPVELTHEINCHIGAHSSLETWEGPALPSLLLGQCWQRNVRRGGTGHGPHDRVTLTKGGGELESWAWGRSEDQGVKRLHQRRLADWRFGCFHATVLLRLLSEFPLWL